jgi:hypothetical protein
MAAQNRNRPSNSNFLRQFIWPPQQMKARFAPLFPVMQLTV